MSEPEDTQLPHEPLFYTELEQYFCERFMELFARVDARQPEKGIRTLIGRARILARESGQPLGAVLELEYQAALQRTERRLALLKQCSIRQENLKG